MTISSGGTSANINNNENDMQISNYMETEKTKTGKGMQL